MKRIAFKPSALNRLRLQHHSERGVSLVIVMLFLVAITGITVWAARQSMLGEGMARNQLDLEVARQAAEAALRDA
ncbi:MAG: PilX N-terminal domain-containing pilus assembly protein, partial [Rhodoferax sp.]